jgi:MFS transporter, SP family, sugar:H+ symporter
MAGTFNVRGAPIGWTAIAVALLASMGGFLFGYDTGQISGIQEMADFVSRFGTEPADGTVEGATMSFNKWLIGLIVSMLSIGTAIGALIGAVLADKLGRRYAMFVEVIVFDIGVIIQVTSFNAWYQVGIGRLITGLGVGALSSAVPLYQSETLPRQIRGAMVGTYQLFITFGILVSNCINIGTRELGISNSGSWRIPIALGIPFATILGVGILFCPESPRWLVAHGKNDEAYRSVAIVRGAKREDSNPWVEAEYAELVTNYEQDIKLGAGSWLECFKKPNRVLYRTLLGIALQAGQQLTGANYFFYFGATIFSAVNLQDPFVTQIILGAVNFGSLSHSVKSYACL